MKNPIMIIALIALAGALGVNVYLLTEQKQGLEAQISVLKDQMKENEANYQKTKADSAEALSTAQATLTELKQSQDSLKQATKTIAELQNEREQLKQVIQMNTELIKSMDKGKVVNGPDLPPGITRDK